jgi:hypothetical protein
MLKKIQMDHVQMKNSTYKNMTLRSLQEKLPNVFELLLINSFSSSFLTKIYLLSFLGKVI